MMRPCRCTTSPPRRENCGSTQGNSAGPQRIGASEGNGRKSFQMLFLVVDLSSNHSSRSSRQAACRYLSPRETGIIMTMIVVMTMAMLMPTIYDYFYASSLCPHLPSPGSCQGQVNSWLGSMSGRDTDCVHQVQTAAVERQFSSPRSIVLHRLEQLLLQLCDTIKLAAMMIALLDHFHCGPLSAQVIIFVRD